MVLLPVSLVPLLGHGAGWGYALVATATGIAYLAASITFARRPDDGTARRLLHVSLVYLPVLFIALIVAVMA